MRGAWYGLRAMGVTNVEWLVAGESAWGIAPIVKSKIGGCDAPLKERFALGALRLRSVPSELEDFLPQAQRSSSETLIKRSAL